MPEVPEYPETRIDKWKIFRKDPPFIRGYFKGLQGSKPNYVLQNVISKEVVMSTTPMEIESQAPHVASATGNVLVAGAGLGVYLYNVIKKREVKNVTVVEIDSTIIRFLLEIIDVQEWKGRSKIKFFNEDIFDFSASRITSHKVKGVDFLYVDIWNELMDGKALEDTKRIQSSIKAKSVGFWGQELEFIDWLNSNGYKPPPTMYQLRKWKKETKLPLVVNYDGYNIECLKAAENVSLY